VTAALIRRRDGRLIRRRGEPVGRVAMLAMVAARNCTDVERANPLLDFAHFFTVFAGPRCRGGRGGPATLLTLHFVRFQ